MHENTSTTCAYADWRIKKGKLTVVERNENPEYWKRMVLRKTAALE